MMTMHENRAPAPVSVDACDTRSERSSVSAGKHEPCGPPCQRGQGARTGEAPDGRIS